MTDPDRLELETPEAEFTPQEDGRPRIPEPLPVKLVSVEDMTLPATSGQEHALDAFYAGLLRFEKEPGEAPTYRADNFRLRFVLHEGLVRRDSYRPVQIEVQSLQDAERALIDAEIEYLRQRGLASGQSSLALLDPAGNMVELVESKPIL